MMVLSITTLVTTLIYFELMSWEEDCIRSFSVNAFSVAAGLATNYTEKHTSETG